jgi:hypothetical protein
MEISERLDLDALWCNAAILTSMFLVSSGSATEGLQLADQARRRADPIDETATGTTVAWIGGVNYSKMGHPLEAQNWFTHELAKPRTARSAIRRRILQQRLANACTQMGRLTEAHTYWLKPTPRKGSDQL